jgi:hypothetical protein
MGSAQRGTRSSSHGQSVKLLANLPQREKCFIHSAMRLCNSSTVLKFQRIVLPYSSAMSEVAQEAKHIQNAAAPAELSRYVEFVNHQIAI